MSDTIRMNINLPTDDQGMVGRICPDCRTFFKLRPGTGIANIGTTACPYCDYQGDPTDFTTQEQVEYATSVMAKKVVEPLLRDFQRSLKRLERSSRNSMIRFKIKSSSISLPIKYYSEPELETLVHCDNCGLAFAVYGLFARCPDCMRPNSMVMFRKSIEVVRKRLNVFHGIPEDEGELRDAILIDSISAAVSTFDSLGKRMRTEFPQMLPSHPRNLFQNLAALEDALNSTIGVGLVELIGEEDYQDLSYMFQVRHIWNHNFGEADQDFIGKTGADQTILGKRIIPTPSEVENLISIVESIGVQVRTKLGDST